MPDLSSTLQRLFGIGCALIWMDTWVRLKIGAHQVIHRGAARVDRHKADGFDWA
jgi:hypothetical protein